MKQQSDFRIRRESVKGLSGEELVSAVIEPIWPGAGIHDEDELTRIAQGTPGQQAIYATTLFAREVDNGGLRQFFGNSSGMYARYVAEGLTLLGAHELLKAFSAGTRIFPQGEVPLDRSARNKFVEDAASHDRNFFDQIDERLYQGSGVEEQLVPYFTKYIDDHPTEFFLD